MHLSQSSSSSSPLWTLILCMLPIILYLHIIISHLISCPFFCTYLNVCMYVCRYVCFYVCMLYVCMYWWWCWGRWSWRDCYDDLKCPRIIKTMMTIYEFWVCMYVFIDLSMYVFIISLYWLQHIMIYSCSSTIRFIFI